MCTSILAILLVAGGSFAFLQANPQIKLDPNILTGIGIGLAIGLFAGYGCNESGKQTRDSSSSSDHWIKSIPQEDMTTLNEYIPTKRKYKMLTSLSDSIAPLLQRRNS